MKEHTEINDNDSSDKRPEDHQELSLGHEICLAGLINQLGDIPHGFMHRKVFYSKIIE